MGLLTNTNDHDNPGQYWGYLGYSFVLIPQGCCRDHVGWIYCCVQCGVASIIDALLFFSHPTLRPRLFLFLAILLCLLYITFTLHFIAIHDFIFFGTFYTYLVYILGGIIWFVVLAGQLQIQGH